MNDELRRQTERFEPVLAISPNAIIITDLHARVVAWNPAAERLFGYTGREAIGQNLDDLVAKNEELHAEAVAFSKRASAKGHVYTAGRRTRKDGSLVDVEILAAPLEVDGRTVGTFAIYHDISELQRQKRYFESLVELSPSAVVTMDLDDEVTSWNPEAEKLFGYTAEEAIGRNVDSLVAKSEEIHGEAASLNRQAEQGRVALITRRTRKDGSLVDVEVSAAPIVVGGQPVGLLAIYHDISELQRQKRYHESLVELSPSAVVALGLDDEVTSWNPEAEKLFGYTAEEALGRTIDDLVAKGDEIHAEATSINRQAEQGRVALITRRTRKDGSLVDVEVSAAPIVVGGRRVGLLAIYHDISELQRQKRYSESLVELSPSAVVTTDLDDRITSWNPAAERLFHYTSQEAIGRNIDSLVAKSGEVHAEARSINRQAEQGEIRVIGRRTRKDGSLVDVTVSAAPVAIGGQRVGLLAIYHDISDLQRARQEAEAATQAKSAFLATMSHEIRTPMNAVIGMTGLLLDSQLTPEQRRYTEVIRDSGDSLLTIINDILDFSKIEAGRLDLETKPFDLRECLEAALELAAASAMKKGLDLAYDLDPDAPRALVGDAARLRQILINLLNNAVKFTERGEVVLSVSAEALASGDGSNEPAGEGGRYRLHFAVRDTGIGIPPDQMDRLFESFSQVDASTTRRYGGTGLGLAISKRLTKLMDGTMSAESRVGEGSTFHFTIEAEAAPAPIRAYERRAAPQLEGKRVLIVDDNATNRHILARQVQGWGMLARDTESPEEALEWVRRGDPFDLGILDMQMPDMDGLTLAREIRRHRDAGALPLVMLTSLGRREKAPDVGFAAYLTKPIKPSQLYDALMEVFGLQPAPAEPAPAEQQERLGERLPLRVLVAEDNAVNQQLAVLLLQKLGYRADVAANGVEALEALERQPYDVVLMDVEMPEMDGLEATRRIHQRWPQERPRIIAVTANVMQGEREACLEAGMDDYLGKPIRMPELVAAMQRSSSRETGRDVGPRADGGAEASGPGDWPKAVDRAVLQRLVDQFGAEGPRFAVELIETFLDGAPGQLSTLRQALDRGSAAVMRRGAHTMKANAESFGAADLAATCRELEALGRAGHLEGAANLLDRLEGQFERVKVALERHRQELMR